MRYWGPVLFFGGILAALILCAAPDTTWINTCSDGSHYVWAARDLRLAHSPGAPLYLLVGHLFTLLPGNDFWNLTLFSAAATVGSCIMLYLIMQRITNHKLLWYLCPLLFVSSPLVFGQSTIVETYALVTFFMLLAFYLYGIGRLSGAAFVLGLGLAVHHLIVLAAFPILVHAIQEKQFRWKYVAFAAAGLLFYVYVPLVCNKQPYLWGDTNWIDYFMHIATGSSGLLGGIAAWEIPERSLHALCAFGILIPVLPLLFLRVRQNRLLLVLSIVFVVYYVTDLAPQTVVYMVPAIAFASILLCLQLAQYQQWRDLLAKPLLVAAAVSLIGCVAFMNIGATLDRDMSAVEFQRQLGQIPDGSILILREKGWENTTAIIYFHDHQKDVVVFMPYHYIAHPFVEDDLMARGYTLPLIEEDVVLDIDEVTQDFLDLNPQITTYYTTETTDAESYGCRVIAVEKGAP